MFQRVRNTPKVAISCLAALAIATPCLANPRQMVASLSGMQENPANASTGLGCGTFLIDTDANTLRYHIVYTGLSAPETGAHIHGAAAPGTNAGVLHPLPLGSPKIGVWNYAEANEADILAGNMYVNIHSTAIPSGEIRGQISDLVCEIDAGQENPPTGTAGRGWGAFFIDTNANTLDYYIAFGGLSAAETAAHIHGFTAHGANAGVLHPLPAGSPKIGTWNYAEAQEAAILDGLTYVNIHSAAFAGGEIRGQIVAAVAPIDPSQENPPTASTGAGCALISIDRANDVLGYDVRHAGLTTAQTAAHFHGFAAPGSNAGVKHGIGVGPRILGTWNYVAADETGILDGLTYVNIHSVMFGGGEIRGQVEFIAPSCPCEGDADGNGVIDVNDIAFVIFRLGNTGAPGIPGDVDGNGTVDVNDIAFVIFRLGNPCLG